MSQPNLRDSYVTRDAILKLLSDDEVASVSTAETAPRLLDGEEYIDLEQLDGGVRRAILHLPSMGSVLPRKSVQSDTWTKVVAELASLHTRAG